MLNSTNGFHSRQRGTKEKLQRELQKLRKQRDEAFDAIMEKSQQIKESLRQAVMQTTGLTHLFTLRWQVR